jgi:hypothetical protein
LSFEFSESVERVCAAGASTSGGRGPAALPLRESRVSLGAA